MVSLPLGSPPCKAGVAAAAARVQGPEERALGLCLASWECLACQLAEPQGQQTRVPAVAVCAEAARGLQADGEALTIEQKTKSSLQATASAGGSDAAGLAAAGPAVMAAAACWLAP